MFTVRNATQFLLAFAFICFLQTPAGLSDVAHGSFNDDTAAAVFDPSTNLHTSPLDIGVETGIRRDKGLPKH